VARNDALSTLESTLRIYLVRHGETVVSRGGLYRDGARLTKRGRAQARALAAVLPDFGVTRLVTSGMRRAFETVRPLERATGMRAAAMPGLNEISNGWLRDAPIEQIVEKAGSGEWRMFFEEYGGESAGSFAERVIQSFERLADGGVGQVDAVAAIIHGGSINVILDYVRGRRFDGRLRHLLPNASISLLESAGHGFHVGFVGVTGHLTGAAQPRQ